MGQLWKTLKIQIKKKDVKKKVYALGNHYTGTQVSLLYNFFPITIRSINEGTTDLTNMCHNYVILLINWVMLENMCLL